MNARIDSTGGARRQPTRMEQEAGRMVGLHKTAADVSSQMNAWMRLFTKVNTIVVGRRIPTITDESLPFPAATDGSAVKFSTDWLRTEVVNPLHMGSSSLVKRTIAKLKGINFHEVAHVLYSPARSGSVYSNALISECTNRGVFLNSVYGPANLIEDQRIESLFSAEYTGSKPYFRMSTLHALLEDVSGNQSDPSMSFFWTHGRRYLPASVRNTHRAAAEAAFGSAVITEWMRIMDEYVTLNLVNDCDRAATLTVDAALLLKSISANPMPEDHNGQPGTDRSTTKSDETRMVRSAEKAKQEVEEQKAEEEADEDDSATSTCADGEDSDEDSGDGSGDDTDTDGNADGEGDGEGAEQSDEDGQPGDATGDSGDSDGDESTDGDSSDPSSSAGGRSGGLSDSDSDSEIPLEQILNEAIEDLLSDNNFNRELDALLNDFKSEAERGPIERPVKSRVGSQINTTPESVGTVNRIVKVLNQMRHDAGDAWDRGLPHGKVNVMDFINRDRSEVDFFESHTEGNEDEFDMEVVALLDMSPSMMGMASMASLALWKIKLTMQRFDVPVTAYGYNDGNAKTLYGPHDYVQPGVYENFGCGGHGTDPMDALQRAYNILSRSRAKRKILFTITDGEWNPANRWESDAVVSRINNLPGATSIIIGLTNYPGTLLRDSDRTTYHQHQIGKEVTDPAHIVDIFKQYVYEIGRKAARR